MKDKAFIDSNLIIYLYSIDQKEKSDKVNEIILNRDAFISTQVLNEISSVMFKKFDKTAKEIKNIIIELSNFFNIAVVSQKTILKALNIKNLTHYSYYDSLIIASSLECNCKKLFSEDMSHLQVIENKLTILNPFK